MADLVFADAAFFIALLLPRKDDLYELAHLQWQELDPRQIATSEPVLVEVLAHVSALGSDARERAAMLVEYLRSDPFVTLVAQTPELFDDGLALYRARLDKQYSLTDCMSMTICTRLGIEEVLTHDRHFQQEGFTILL